MFKKMWQWLTGNLHKESGDVDACTKRGYHKYPKLCRFEVQDGGTTKIYTACPTCLDIIGVKQQDAHDHLLPKIGPGSIGDFYKLRLWKQTTTRRACGIKKDLMEERGCEKRCAFKEVSDNFWQQYNNDPKRQAEWEEFAKESLSLLANARAPERPDSDTSGDRGELPAHPRRQSREG